MHFIFLENRSIGLHFATESILVEIFMVGYAIFVYFGEQGVSDIQGHPRSLMLVPIESAYVTSY